MKELNTLSLEIEKLINKGAVEFCNDQPDQFLSPYFLVPKPDGTHRFILNLKKLNEFIDTDHFKIEDLKMATSLISKFDYLGNVDLQDAYFSIPIHKVSRKFFRFRFKGKLMQFTCLAFGFSKSPYIFTKVLKPVMAYLRALGLYSVIYLDDILCIGSSVENCKFNLEYTVNFLQWLGFVVNFKKCNLVPSWKCKFLGFNLDTYDLSLRLPEDKRAKLINLIDNFISKSVCSIAELAQIIGKLISACPAVQYGMLYTKILESEKISALVNNHYNYNAKITIPKIIIPDLIWWRDNLVEAFRIFKTPEPIKIIFTDASDLGWGATDGTNEIFGFWSNTDVLHHINYKELLTVKLALISLTKNITNAHVLLRVDNTTAISYVNKMGGVKYKKYSKLARQIWQLAEVRKLTLSASYISSRENKDADRLSRLANPDAEWQLSAYAFSEVVSVFGQPEVDLFATRLNKKCNLYVSWFPDKEAMQIDAFTLKWNSLNFYAFPPFVLVLRVLVKIRDDRARGIIVVPNWPNQLWFPLFSKLVEGVPLLLGPAPNLLLSACRNKRYPGASHLTLLAAIVSGHPS